MADVNIKYRGSSIATMSASGTKTLGTQGKYCDSDVVVEYTKPAQAVIESNKNATPSESAQDITPSSGYDAMAKVTVGAVSSSYVGTAVPRKSSSDLTASGATVTAPAGYYQNAASATVPNATWKSASTVGVVPEISVDSSGLITANCSGWTSIHPLTASGYADSDTAANIQLSGTRTSQLSTQAAQTITPTTSDQTIASGKYLTGAQTIKGDANLLAANIKKNVTLFNIVGSYEGGGGSGLEYETGTYTPSSDIARPQILWSKTHTEAPVLVYMCDATGTASTTTNSNHVFMYADPYKLWGVGYPYTSSGFRYANAWYCYRGTNTSSISAGGTMITYNSSDTTSSGASYPRYWVSPTDFHPYTNSTTRYWRSGRTYKWIAVWKP